VNTRCRLACLCLAPFVVAAVSIGCTPTAEDVVAGDSSTTGPPAGTTQSDTDAPADSTSDGDGTVGDAGTTSDDGASTATVDTSTGDMLVAYGGIASSLGVGDTTEDAPPLAGAEVCVTSIDPPTCTTTDDTGAWSLMVPPSDDALWLELTAADHLGLRYVTVAPASDELGFSFWLATDELASAFWSSCDAAWPETQAAISVNAYSLVAPDTYEFLEGGTASVVDGVGPCYMASPWIHDAALTSTTVDGWGTVVFANVPADTDTVDVSLMAPDKTCASFGGILDGEMPEVVRVPVTAAMVTAVDVVCAP
jgi:hypothetical protein